MASDRAGSIDRLATVSSLYGSGTTTCWYLTASSVLVSWTLHPYKRKSGSIDVDLIATLILPSVAAGHVISQAYGSIRQLFEAQDPRLIPAVAAIEAPFVIVETFMALSVIPFLIAAWMVKIRRAIFVAVVGLLCFIVECDVHFSDFASFRLRYRPEIGRTDFPTFTRRFVADFNGLIVTILITLSLVVICSISIIGILSIFFPEKLSISCRDSERTQQTHEIPTATIIPSHRNTSTQATNTQEDGLDDTQRVLLRRLQRLENDSLQKSGEDNRALASLTVISVLFLPLSFFATIFPTILNSAQAFDKGTSFWRALKGFVNVFVRGFFPQSNYSILDLDQAVAVAAGATVLAFNIYSVAKAYHKSFKAHNEAGLEQ